MIVVLTSPQCMLFCYIGLIAESSFCTSPVLAPYPCLMPTPFYLYLISFAVAAAVAHGTNFNGRSIDLVSHLVSPRPSMRSISIILCCIEHILLKDSASKAGEKGAGEVGNRHKILHSACGIAVFLNVNTRSPSRIRVERLLDAASLIEPC